MRTLVAAEVEARDLTACRLLAAFERHRGSLLPVAFLAFDDEVQLVHTAPSHRRRGIASALLARAREDVPALRHSGEHTQEGAAWARARGLEVPDTADSASDAEVAWAASAVYLYLTHCGPAELIELRSLRRGRRPGRRRRR